MIALLIAGAFSMAFTLFLTPLFIRLFKRLGWGQFIRDDGVAGEQLTHHTKRGTPTMGGIVFLVGGFLGYLVGHWVAGVPWTMVGVLVFGMAFGLGLVGFVDDFTKTRKQRSLGIGGWTKIVGQVIVGSRVRRVRDHRELPRRERPDAGIDEHLGRARHRLAQPRGVRRGHRVRACS